jgi:flagellar basal body-associated protein FliL
VLLRLLLLLFIVVVVVVRAVVGAIAMDRSQNLASMKVNTSAYFTPVKVNTKNLTQVKNAQMNMGSRMTMLSLGMPF